MSSASTGHVVLLQFSGADRPGLAAALTDLLARHQAEILDIGQAVVHQSLSLGILIAAPADEDMAALKAALTARAHELGLQLHVARVRPDALATGGHDEAQGQFIVTLLGRAITAQHLARVTAILAAHPMNIDRIERLSGSISAADVATNACLELTVSGVAFEEPALRTEFFTAAQELGIDIAFQRESLYRRNRRLFAFDMDSTLIQAEVIDELAKMAGVGDEVARITESAMRGELVFDESFTRRLGLLKGLPAERVFTLFDSIQMSEGAERLIRTLRMLGYKIAILSGGFTFFAEHVQKKFGIDYIYANELEIIDGKVTGRVASPIVNGARKEALLREIAAREGISLEQVVAVGDGANDIPMLKLAGMGIAYRAKPLVRQSAPQSISSLGLDGLLYLVGVRDHDLSQVEVASREARQK